MGLDYLTLVQIVGDLVRRRIPEDPPGDSDRIQPGGVLYILDEPSIGLHQKDNEKLLATLRTLTDIGNTLIVVEHDEDTMYAADHIVDIGPGAGIHGGELVAEGTAGRYKEMSTFPDRPVPERQERRSRFRKKAREGQRPEAARSKGPRKTTSRSINVDIPLGKLVCVTGVSGSGKSSLVNEILYKGVASMTNGLKERPGVHKKILGIEHIDKVIDINQSPIGRTPRSNPATYTGVFTGIRDLFRSDAGSKASGLRKGPLQF